MQVMITGTIKSLRMTYPASGGPQLSVSGVNVLDDFRRKQEKHVYENKTDSTIAKEVAGRLGVAIRTNPTQGEEQHEYVLQDNKLDILFLMERARIMGYDLFVEEKANGDPQLYFGPSGESRLISYDLKYGLSLIQFSMSLNTANQVNEVVVTSAHPKSKKKIKESAKRSELKIETLADAGRLQGLQKRVFEKRCEVTATEPVQTVQEAKTLAIRKLERIAKELIKGGGSTVGLPDLRAGRFVGIYGIGKHFSGRYFVTSTTHTIGNSGYTTQFECRRE
jgi:phage protein D